MKLYFVESRDVPIGIFGVFTDEVDLRGTNKNNPKEVQDIIAEKIISAYPDNVFKVGVVEKPVEEKPVEVTFVTENTLPDWDNMKWASKRSFAIKDGYQGGQSLKELDAWFNNEYLND